MAAELLFRDTVDSTSSNPELGGQIDIEADGTRLKLRWSGESDWQSFEWFELLVIARSPGLYKEVLEEMKDAAVKEGFEESAKLAAEQEDATYQLGYKNGIEAGQKVIQLKLPK